MKKPAVVPALLCLTLLILNGCASMLPSAQQHTEARWHNYEEARLAFDAIQPGSTSKAQLADMGFDPFKVPNIKLLNYLELMRIFLPNDSIRLADLHPDIQSCLSARNECLGYEVLLGNNAKQRFGNLFLDLFNFRRQTRSSGWQFRGLIVLRKDQVIYKVESGQPNTLEFEDKKNPLGPIQDISFPSLMGY